MTVRSYSPSHALQSVLAKVKQSSQVALKMKTSLPWDPNTGLHLPLGLVHSSLEFQYPRNIPGVIVPQTAYHSFIPFHRMPPLRFSERGKPGIKLLNALQFGLADLDSPDLRCTLTHSSMKVLIRINVSGS